MDDPRVAVWSRVNQARLDDIAGRHEAAFQGAIEASETRSWRARIRQPSRRRARPSGRAILARAPRGAGLHLALPSRGRSSASTG